MKKFRKHITFHSRINFPSILKFLLILFLSINIFSLSGQNCLCDKYVNYSDTCSIHFKKDTCYKQCSELAQRLSFIYKIHDIENHTKILPSKNYIYDLNGSKGTEFPKINLNFMNYLQAPFAIDFFKIETYQNLLILKSSLQIQKMVIKTQEIMDTCNRLYCSCFDCETRVVTDDTIFINADYIYTQKINFIGSRVYFSDISNHIRTDLYNALYQTNTLNGDEFNKFTNIYIELLKLRHVNYELVSAKHKLTVIKIKQALFEKELKLNPANIRHYIKNLIDGGVSE